MFVAIHYIKWNREGILGITPLHTHHTHIHPFPYFSSFFSTTTSRSLFML